MLGQKTKEEIATGVEGVVEAEAEAEVEVEVEVEEAEAEEGVKREQAHLKNRQRKSTKENHDQ